MKFIRNIIAFFKDVFHKKNDIKMIEAPIENLKQDNKTSFMNSLNLNLQQKKKKKKIETLTCFGDGLGMQNKITY